MFADFLRFSQIFNDFFSRLLKKPGRIVAIEKDFFENANEEWVTLEQQQELRKLLPTKEKQLYCLWKDMHDGIIPGKDGKFYKSIHSVIAKYSEGKDSTLYPYD